MSCNVLIPRDKPYNNIRKGSRTNKDPSSSTSMMPYSKRNTSTSWLRFLRFIVLAPKYVVNDPRPRHIAPH